VGEELTKLLVGILVGVVLELLRRYRGQSKVASALVDAIEKNGDQATKRFAQAEAAKAKVGPVLKSIVDKKKAGA
jgi:hypothetical protein